MQRVALNLFSEVVKCGLATKEPLLSSPSRLMGTMLYAHSKTGIDTLAAAEKRIDDSLKAGEEQGVLNPHAQEHLS